MTPVTKVALSLRGRRMRAALSVGLSLALVIQVGCAHQSPRFDPHVRRTCLVLSVGGLAGVAHIGAVEAIQEAKIPISCVVGNSMGALVGSIYASHPKTDPDTHFRRLVSEYRVATEEEAHQRFGFWGLVAGVAAAVVTGGIAVPLLVGGVGGAIAADTTPRLSHRRLVEVLDRDSGSAKIENLPLPFVTFFQETTSSGVVGRRADRGSLAAAVGGSMANALLFSDVEIAPGRTLDPGSDRVSSIPIQEACETFPDANLLVINATGQPSFYAASMKCPVLEVRIKPMEVDAEEVFSLGDAYRRVVASGRAATRAALVR